MAEQPSPPNARRFGPRLRRSAFTLAFAIAAAIAPAAAQPTAAATLDVGCLGPLWSKVSDAFRGAHPEYELAGGQGGASRKACFNAQNRAPDLIYANVRGIVPGPGGETKELLVATFNTGRFGQEPVAVDPTKFTDLTTLSARSRELQGILSGIPPGLLSALTVGGKTWAIPGSVGYMQYAIRLDLFRAAGLAVTEDWDWATFLQDAKKGYSALTAARPGDSHIVGMLLPPGSTIPFWEALLLGNSDEIVDQTGQGHFQSDANQQTLAEFASWFRSGAVSWSKCCVPFARLAGGPIYSTAFLNPDAQSLKGVTVNADGDLIAGTAIMHPMPLPHGPRKRLAPLPAWTNAFLVSADVPTDAVPAAIDFLKSVTTTVAGVQYNGRLPADERLGLAAYGPRVQRYYQWLNRAMFPQGSIGARWQRFAQRFAEFAAGKLGPDEFAALLDATPNG